jgi:hypothetical protein
MVVLTVCGLAAVSAQFFPSSDWSAFAARFPPGQTWGVVVQADLPAIGINGFEGRDKGKGDVEIDVDPDGGWKATTGLFGKAQPTSGPLARGEIVQLTGVVARPSPVDISTARMDLRLVSVEPHDVVLNVRRREQRRREPVGVLLRMAIPASFGPFLSAPNRVIMALDPYVRLFPTLESARAFAATLGTDALADRFTVGVVRRDGILVPFASHDPGSPAVAARWEADHWFRRWPTPAAERDVPIAFGDIPMDWWGLEGPAPKWTMWLENGSSRPLQVAGALGFGAHCQLQVGLRTDYRSPLPMPPLEQHHYPKDGLATTGHVRLEAVEVAQAGTAFWTGVEQLLVPYVTRQEYALAARQGLAWTIREQQRLGTPVKLEVLCLAAGAVPGAVTAYFEATKRYPPTDPSVLKECGPVTFISGWLHRNEANVGIFDVRTTVQATDCTQWNVAFRKPLGLVRLNGTPVWFLQSSRWGRESYDIVRVDKTGIVPLLSVPGGWCTTIGN